MRQARLPLPKYLLVMHGQWYFALLGALCLQLGVSVGRGFGDKVEDHATAGIISCCLLSFFLGLSAKFFYQGSAATIRDKIHSPPRYIREFPWMASRLNLH